MGIRGEFLSRNLNESMHFASWPDLFRRMKELSVGPCNAWLRKTPTSIPPSLDILRCTLAETCGAWILDLGLGPWN